ncbi:right-handed parallel beta-helix repeat-containing protein [Baaleninema sp.]|uniref:right-handed parallel beta-helix repeat-containing protein n=1 Tax=Baaleninema sp. TaxID=3101197 RepID=UPI003D03BC97
MTPIDRTNGKPLTSRRRFLSWSLAAAVASVAVETQRHRVAAETTPDATPDATPDDTEIYVSTAEAFLEAIGSNRTIFVNPGSYDLTNVDRSAASDAVNFEAVHDGEQFHIYGVENLKIIGLGARSPRLLVRPRYATALSLINAQNVVLDNLELGHFPDTGYCSGGVLGLAGCHQIEIKNSNLFGSGTYGFILRNTQNFIARNTSVRHCTYGIASLISVTDSQFIDCEFAYNQKFTLIYAPDSSGIEFNGCEFNDNAVSDEYSAIFDANLANAIVLENCKFENNAADTFSLNPEAFDRIANTAFINNTFRDMPNRGQT